MPRSESSAPDSRREAATRNLDEAPSRPTSLFALTMAPKKRSARDEMSRATVVSEGDGKAAASPDAGSYRTSTFTDFGLTCSALGRVTVSTPSRTAAVTFDGSTANGSEM